MLFTKLCQQISTSQISADLNKILKYKNKIVRFLFPAHLHSKSANFTLIISRQYIF